MKLVKPTVLDLGRLALEMRDDERRQFCALNGLREFDPDLAAQYFVALPGEKFCLLDDDGNPVAAGGYVPSGPGVWQSWMVGTEEGWTFHWRAITKAVRKVMTAMFKDGARRLETEAMADRVEAHRWYVKGLGMTQEGVHPARYADGSTAVSFGRIADVHVSAEE